MNVENSLESASLESVFNWHDNDETVEKISEVSITEDGVTYKSFKKGILAGKLGDLEKLGKKIQILNLYNTKMIVRTIWFTDKEVVIDVMDGSAPLSFPKERKVFYDAWFMDRGSYMFWVEAIGGYGKLATELDPVIVLE